MEKKKESGIEESMKRHAKMPKWLIEMLMIHNKEKRDEETFNKLDEVLDEKIKQEL